MGNLYVFLGFSKVRLGVFYIKREMIIYNLKIKNINEVVREKIAGSSHAK